MNIRILRFYSFILLSCTFTALAVKPVVTIQNDQYSLEQLVQYLSAEGNDPMVAIERIKREKIISFLVDKKGLNAGDANAMLYHQVIGCDYEKDISMVEMRQLPLSQRKKVINRLRTYDFWLSRLAGKYIQVSFTDFPGFWSLVKKTDSYKIRKQSGIEPSIENCLFTRAELMLRDETILATKNGKPYISGREYNFYLQEHFDELKPVIKRKKPVEQLQKTIVTQLMKNKVAGDYVVHNKLKVSESLIEAAIHTFVEHKTFDMDFKLVKDESLTISKVMGNEHIRVRQKHAADISALSRSLRKPVRPSESPDNTLLNFIFNHYARYALMDSFDGVDDTEIYTWMKAEKIQEPFFKARNMYKKRRAEQYIETRIKQQNIALTNALQS